MRGSARRRRAGSTSATATLDLIAASGCNCLVALRASRARCRDTLRLHRQHAAGARPEGGRGENGSKGWRGSAGSGERDRKDKMASVRGRANGPLRRRRLAPRAASATSELPWTKRRAQSFFQRQK